MPGINTVQKNDLSTYTAVKNDNYTPLTIDNNIETIDFSDVTDQSDVKKIIFYLLVYQIPIL